MQEGRAQGGRVAPHPVLEPQQVGRPRFELEGGEVDEAHAPARVDDPVPRVQLAVRGHVVERAQVEGRGDMLPGGVALLGAPLAPQVVGEGAPAFEVGGDDRAEAVVAHGWSGVVQAPQQLAGASVHGLVVLERAPRGLLAEHVRDDHEAQGRVAQHEARRVAAQRRGVVLQGRVFAAVR